MIKYKRPIPISKAQKGLELVYREIDANRLHVDPSGYLVDREGNKYAAAALPKLREEGLVVTGKRIYPLFSPERRALEAAHENFLELEKAKHYFNEAPTLPNLIRGTYHWVRGNIYSLSEDPEHYRYNTGTVDLPILSKKGVATLTGKTLGKLVENVGTRVSKSPIPTATARTFEEGVRTGFLRGLNKGNRLALEAVEQANKGKVSKQAAQRYASMKALKATENMHSLEEINKLKEEVEAASNLAAETIKKERGRAFNLGKLWGQRDIPKPLKTSFTTKLTDKLNNNFIAKSLWETKNRNFGDLYKWRNAARVGAYIYGGPSIVGFGIGTIPRYMRYAGELFEKGRMAASSDSTNVSSPNKLDVVNNVKSPLMTNNLDTIKAGTASSAQLVPILNSTFNPVDNNMFND